MIFYLLYYSYRCRPSTWSIPSFSLDFWEPAYQRAPYARCRGELWHFIQFAHSYFGCWSHCSSEAAAVVSTQFWLLMSPSILSDDPEGAGRKALCLTDFEFGCWGHHSCELMFSSDLELFFAWPSSRTGWEFLQAYFQILKVLDSTYWDSKLQGYRCSM